MLLRVADMAAALLNGLAAHPAGSCHTGKAQEWNVA